MNQIQQHNAQLGHIQNQQTSAPLVNGTVGRSITFIQGQGQQNASIPVLVSCIIIYKLKHFLTWFHSVAIAIAIKSINFATKSCY